MSDSGKGKSDPQPPAELRWSAQVSDRRNRLE